MGILIISVLAEAVIDEGLVSNLTKYNQVPFTQNPEPSLQLEICNASWSYFCYLPLFISIYKRTFMHPAK
jgi:hypothetical protein